MPEENKIQDIEFGGEEENNGGENLKINNYTSPSNQKNQGLDASKQAGNINQGLQQQSTPVSNNTIDPYAKAEMPKKIDNFPEKKVDTRQIDLKKEALNEKRLKKRKKAILGCFGGFFAVLILLIIMSFIFISTSSATSDNPFAKLLGLNYASFVNGLIAFIHINLFMLTLAISIIAISGALKLMTAKKDEKDIKKSAIRRIVISISVLFFTLISWVFIWDYLDDKRVETTEVVKEAISTEPSVLTDLTAPITITFDAANVPNTSEYQIVQYKWDFGDGETKIGQKVSHTYKEKGEGVYDVKLTIKKRHKTTGEEQEIEFRKIVTIINDQINAVFEMTPDQGKAPLVVSFDASASSDPDSQISSFEWDMDGDGDFDDEIGYKPSFEFEESGEYEIALKVTNELGEEATVKKTLTVTEEILPEPVISSNNEEDTYTTNVNYIFSAEDSSSENGTIEIYEWKFSDTSGKFETKTVTHIFEAAGEYEISLKVVDETGEENEITETITVGKPAALPTAVISTTPLKSNDSLTLEGTKPFTVEFSAENSTDPDDDIVDYKWDFDGDSNYDDYGKNISYTYQESGYYNATLTVVDSKDNEDSAEISINVQDQGIIVDLTADPIEGNVPVTVNFDASGSTYDGGSITSYKWDFGDGTQSKLGSAKISHKYQEIGVFTASVEIIGSDNTTKKQEILITVREIPLTACFSPVFTSGTAPLKNSFDPGCSTGSISNYFWDFGDGQSSTDIKAKHTFSEPGEYTVTLEVSDADSNVDTQEMTITVKGEETI